MYSKRNTHTSVLYGGESSENLDPHLMNYFNLRYWNIVQVQFDMLIISKCYYFIITKPP